MNPTEGFAAIAALDLNPIKTKLMHAHSGEGWSQEKVDAVEFEYRRFLYLMKLFPHERTSPSMDVDIFWHYHILDTIKYAVDCEQAFGYFLHHYPYVGLGDSEEDVEERTNCGNRMQELYELTFGAPASGAPAYCGIPAANGAYCGAAKDATAYCGASKGAIAYCGATKGATAYCGASKGATAYCGSSKGTAAYCGSPQGATAYCGAAKGAAAYCGATTGSKPAAAAGQASAYCGAAAGRTYCGVAASPVSARGQDRLPLAAAY